MRDVWVTSAQQVVALCATPGGVASLSEQLGVSLVEAERLSEATRAALSPSERSELEIPADTADFGLGALPPEKEDDDA